ncbi:hypothetical protein Zmor_010914 [Zophobas morio]|uniref:Uncharacterized protein n=1 Tax=Zophobas morio TaxID=2755281 RepID=A0AA38MKF7_9CUCU|nr:hypothetical protein Zmor_010914 [Zophobas morio]
MFIIHDDTDFVKLCPNYHVDKCQRLLDSDKYKLTICGSNPGCGRWFYVRLPSPIVDCLNHTREVAQR